LAQAILLRTSRSLRSFALGSRRRPFSPGMALYTIIDFVAHCETEHGEAVYIVGDHQDLGDWDESAGVKLETDKASYPKWATTKPWLLKLPEGLGTSEVQFKICKVDKDGEASFEEIAGNRRMIVTAMGAGLVTKVEVKFNEPEKEPWRIPKFRPPPPRTASGTSSSQDNLPFMKKDGSQSEMIKVASGGSMNSGMSGMRRVESGSGLDYKMQAAAQCGKELSFWHDIPLFPVSTEDESIPFIVNFVCEIPKTTRKKFEVDTKGVGNAIKQDTKNGKPREYSKGDVWFNYGCLPRTWEDTDFVHPDVGFPGDGDPLDACEIGMRMFATGEVRQTKVLGVICMIDEDETDWKLIVIDAEDRWAPELNDVADVERLVPGALDQIREWWRTYKVTDGKPLNKFGLDEKFMPREYAMEVIVECHEAWRKACSKVEEPALVQPLMARKSLSFSKLEDLNLDSDEAAIKKVALHGN